MRLSANKIYFILVFFAFLAQKSFAQKDTSWYHLPIKFTLSTDLTRLVALPFKHREFSVMAHLPIYKRYLWYANLGYVRTESGVEIANLDKNISKGAYLRTGLEYRVMRANVGYNFGAGYIFSRSEETNYWLFSTNYWQDNYILPNEIKNNNHGFELYYGVNVRLSKRLMFTYRNSFNFLFGKYEKENFKRFYVPGFGYDFPYHVLMIKRPYQNLFTSNTAISIAYIF